jgi:hypothetical protein
MMADDTGLLRGILEADETYVGGKRKRGQKSSRDRDGDQPKGREGSRSHGRHRRRARRSGTGEEGRDAS